MRDIFPRLVFGPLRLQVLVVACCLATQPIKAQQPAGSTVYEFKGTIKAAREAEIAARVDGRLVHINFTAGQIVKEGRRPALRVRPEIQADLACSGTGQTETHGGTASTFRGETEEH